MSLKFDWTRIRLDFIAIALLSFFIASGCCINWQENVRPKLYVELGKIFILFYHNINIITRRHIMSALYTNESKKRFIYVKFLKKIDYYSWEILKGYNFPIFVLK